MSKFLRPYLLLSLPLLLASCSAQQVKFTCDADKLAPALINSGAAIATDIPAPPEVAIGAALTVAIDPLVHAQAQAICSALEASNGSK